MNQWLIAAVWMGLALIASMISIRLAISVALVEIIVGIIGGNLLHPSMVVTDWIKGTSKNLKCQSRVLMTV